LVSRSIEVRLAARLVDRALAVAPSAVAVDARRTQDHRLTVHPEGEWFAWQGSGRILCGRRPVIRRIVRALAEARIARPGRPVPAEVLLEAAWPGEKIFPEAAKNRLRVAVCR